MTRVTGIKDASSVGVSHEMMTGAKMRGRKRKAGAVSLAGIGAIIGAIMLIPATAANAGPLAGRSSTGLRIVGEAQAKMTLDCAALTGKVLQYAVKHDYCTAGGNGVAPQDTVSGNCGTSEVYIENDGNGYGVIIYGFASSQGTVVYRDLTIGWGGNLAEGIHDDNGWMYSTSYYATTNEVYPGAGPAYADMGGSVQLLWGATCYIAEPYSITTIT
jgi:hypothetical protein